jgi:hypothetical protein
MKIPMIISSRSPEGVGHTLEQTAEIFANSGLSAKYGRVITWFARYYSNVENIPNHLPFEYVEKMSAAAKSSSPFAIAKQDLGTIDTRHSALLIVKLDPLTGIGVEHSDVIISETINSRVYPRSLGLMSGVEFSLGDHETAQEILDIQHSAGIDLAYLYPGHISPDSPDLQPKIFN